MDRRQPSSTEVEVSLFGPGYGESVVLHLGNGEWAIVDSCRYIGDTEPAPLLYLQDLGVDVSSQVSLVVASHWHDDHIRGISRVFEACKSAKFACPAAFQSREFLELLRLYSKPVQAESSGLDELRDVFAELRRRQARPHYCLENRELLRHSFELDGKFVCATLTAASPSDEALERALVEVRANGVEAKNRKKRARRDYPNHSAIVLMVQIGAERLVLGSDLEVTTSATDGWSRIVNAFSPLGKARVLKVPHHGSETAHHDGVWTDLLVEQPIAVLTPFQRGKVLLPTPQDIDRLLARSARIFSTTSPKSLQMKIPNKLVSTLVDGMITSPLVAHAARGGQLRLRRELRTESNDWTVELADGAVQFQARDAAAEAAA